MEINNFSDKYKVKMLNETDLDNIYALCKGNPMYYEYCPPDVTKENILEDMFALPPGKETEDKFYIGFFDSHELIAVMDIVDGYPEKGIAFIGFFMTASKVQNKGVGSEIVSGVLKCLKGEGYRAARLAWVTENPQARKFWLKNKFVPICETKSNAAERVTLAQRELL